ncbi:MAG TPA: hypothetical protein VG479_10815 [Gaiellaceae bacterium]|nr:hypothetical protein [Gaiellaceae bacterium]
MSGVSVGVRLALGLLALAVPLAAAGCGAGAETSGSGAPTSSTPAVQVDTTASSEHRQKPPPIVLESEAGRQTAVRGSYCVEYVDEAAGEAGGTCADSAPVEPARLSTVRPGEEVRILLVDADVARPEGCSGEEERSCIGNVAVHPLCRKRTVAEIPLAVGPETTWRADLAPGAYELEVFASFDAPDGRTGDVSGSLGVLVDETAPLEIAPARTALRCGE